MWQEFIESIINAQVSPTERPFVQANARAITESVPPLTQKETEGDLPYPYPGKNPSGEI
jgi:hypothetical protein